MSVPVDLAALRAQIARYGANAFLVTTADAGGPPHLSSVLVEATGDELTMGCGKTTRANVATRPDVALLWPEGPHRGYCLIVDALAQDGGGPTLTVRPTAAVLHRVAGAPAGLPRCLPLEPS
jgi:hypothetical protein